MNNPVELLRDYLRTADPVELQADWDAVEALGLEGPTLTEVLELAPPAARGTPTAMPLRSPTTT